MLQLYKPCNRARLGGLFMLNRSGVRYSRRKEVVYICNSDVGYDEGSLQEVWTVTMTMTDVECLRLI